MAGARAHRAGLALALGVFLAGGAGCPAGTAGETEGVPCNSDGDCYRYEQCLAGFCQPGGGGAFDANNTGRPDASGGRDAADPDASQNEPDAQDLDAGRPDVDPGGPDASTSLPDSGASDVMLPDVFSLADAGLDAGLPDVVNLPDAGHDAGLPDVLDLPDAGIDAGLPDVVNLPDAGPPVRIAGARVLYRFDEGSGTTVTDQSGVTPALNLTLSENGGSFTWQSDGLAMDKARAYSSEAATKVTSACKASNQVTLEAWYTPLDPAPTGPTRVITVSLNGSVRNASLMGGRNGPAGPIGFAARVKSSNGSLQGYPQFDGPAGSDLDVMAHAVFVMDLSGVDDRIEFYIDGALSTATQVNVGEQSIGPDFSDWDESFFLAVGDELGVGAETGRAAIGVFHLAAIYCDALTPAEISQNYLAGPQG